MLAAAAVALALASPGAEAKAVATAIAEGGPRPAGSIRERRAHRRLREAFEAAGLDVTVQRFPTPHGRSRNVIGKWAGREDCVRVLMSHADTVPPSPGAEDNASGLGVLSVLAGRLDAIDPPCDVWLVATGAEERIYTGRPDHLGALALREIVPRRRLRYALSLDEVGSRRHFLLRSPVGAPRRRVERELLDAAAGEGVDVGWATDGGTGNSDHREFELAGMRGVKLGVTGNPCRHESCDRPDRLRRRAFGGALRVVEAVLGRE